MKLPGAWGPPSDAVQPGPIAGTELATNELDASDGKACAASICRDSNCSKESVVRLMVEIPHFAGELSPAAQTALPCLSTLACKWRARSSSVVKPDRNFSHQR